MNRRKFIRSLSRTALVLPFADIVALASPWQQQPQRRQTKSIGPQERSYDAKPAPPPPGPKSPIEGTPLGVSFVDVVQEAGLNVKTIYGGRRTNKYLLETTGCGLAFYDYDEDGWLDLFLVNGWRLEGFPARAGTALPSLQEQSRWNIYRCDGRLRTRAQDGLGPGVLRRRLQQRWPRRSVCYLLRPERPLSQQRQRDFTDVTEQAGLIQPGPKTRWNTGCTFVDYDRDGHLDLFVANYVDFDLKTAPKPEDGPCTYKGILVACGPPGLAGRKKHSVSQQWRRNLHRCEREIRHVDRGGHLWPERGGL